MDDLGRARELGTLPGLVELDITTGEVRVNRAALPRAAERVVFGRGLAARVVPEAVARLADPARPGILVLVGESSSKVPGIAALVDGLRSLGEGARCSADVPGPLERRVSGAAPGTVSVNIFIVHGHADHEAIRAGIAAVRQSRVGLVVAVGGGTTIDVGKSVAALACQDDERGAGACGGTGPGAGATVSADVTEGVGWSADTGTGSAGTGGEASAGIAAHAPAGSARAGFQRVVTAHAHADASADSETGVGSGKNTQVQQVQQVQLSANGSPAVAADENEDVDIDIAAYQLGRRRVAPERALPWVAVPTTAGTGSESTDNAVIELGDEKKSLRGIPAPRLIVADPALTDSLPLVPTVVAAVDALAQSLEVLTNSAASTEVQEVALAAFATLARGIEDLYLVATRRIGGTGSDSGSSDDPAAQGGPEDLAHRGQPSDASGRRSFETAPGIPDADSQPGCGGTALLSPPHPAEPNCLVELGEAFQAGQHDRFDCQDHPPRVNPSLAPPERERPVSAMLATFSTSAARVAATTRDTLCWGSLLMGIAFAHARLGLPHALVHFCNRFGLSHGNMVGMLLAPGLAVQARDPETAKRLVRAAQALDRVLRCREVPSPEGPAPGSRISQTSVPGAASLGVVVPKAPVPSGSELLFQWLETRIPALFAATGLPCSLRAAGLARADLDWIVTRELESRPSFGTPARPATPGELKEVLERAFDTG